MGWQPTGISAAKAFAQHILETKPDAKIAILFQNDDFGKDYVKGAREALGDKADKMTLIQVMFTRRLATGILRRGGSDPSDSFVSGLGNLQTSCELCIRVQGDLRNFDDVDKALGSDK